MKPASPGLTDHRVFALLFAGVYAVVYVLLQEPFADPGRLLMEKDQMELLYEALIGNPRGYSIGTSEMNTLPVLQLGYALFFLFGQSLVALFWTLILLKLAALLGTWWLLRRHLPPLLGELLALLFLFDAHRHWDYWSAFLPNTHSEPLALVLLLSLALFHARGRMAFFHTANVTVCLLMNFHFVNGILLLVPAAVAWVNRARFGRRDWLLAPLPYLVLGLLFLPQLAHLPSLLTQGAAPGGPPPAARTIAISAANLFAGQSALGLLGLFGLGFVLRRSWRARPGGGLVEGLALATLASLLALAGAYLLVGEILVLEAAYRLRAFLPAIVLAHFFVLLEVIAWAEHRSTRGVLVSLALLLAPLHALERPGRLLSGELPRPVRSAARHRSAHPIASGARLGAQIFEETGARGADLGARVHLASLERELRFFVEAASRRGEAPPPEEGVEHVVELRSAALEATIHPVRPCLHLPGELPSLADPQADPAAGWREIDCPSGAERRYLYVTLRKEMPPPAPRAGGTVVEMVVAPELDSPSWDDVRRYRSREPVAFADLGADGIQVAAPTESRSLSLFESPVILPDFPAAER